MAAYTIGNSGYVFTVGDALSVFRISGDGSIGSLVWQEATLFGQRRFSAAAHVAVGNDHSMVLLSPGGTLEIRRINANGAIGETLSSSQIGRSGSLALATYETGGRGYAFVIQRAL